MKHRKTIMALTSAAVLIIWAICVSTFFIPRTLPLCRKDT